MPAAAIIGPIIGAVGGIAGGLIGGEASGSAADAQAAAAKYAADLEMRRYEQTREDMMPFLEAGYAQIPYTQRAQQDYEGLRTEGPGRFEDSDYFGTLKASLGEAAKALGRRASARGQGLASLAQPMADYAVPLAGALRGDWINEWRTTKLGPAGRQGQIGESPIGSSGVGTLGQLGYGAGRGMAESARYGGEAKASGYLGRGRAYSGMLNTGMNSLAQLYGGGGFGGRQARGPSQHTLTKTPGGGLMSTPNF